MVAMRPEPCACLDKASTSHPKRQFLPSYFVPIWLEVISLGVTHAPVDSVWITAVAASLSSHASLVWSLRRKR